MIEWGTFGLKYGTFDYCDVSDLVGKTFHSIVHDPRNEALMFFSTEDGTYVMYHEQNCCEHVRLEDVVGDLKDLENNPILKAEERTETGTKSTEDTFFEDSYTWTFYELATIKGSTTLRWLGESNGFYSEKVSLVKIKEEDEREN